MKTNKNTTITILLLLLVLVVIVIYINVSNFGNEERKYTKEELHNMSDEELYELFIKNGLKEWGTQDKENEVRIFVLILNDENERARSSIPKEWANGAIKEIYNKLVK